MGRFLLTMMEHPISVTQWLLLAVCWIATSYSLVAAFAMPFFSKRPDSRRVGWTSVSVLKPLCGIEPRLYENLVTFCKQAHPCFQLLCGVSSPVDPAIGVVRRLQAEYPHCDIKLVIDSRVHGSNPKVSNLINMVQWARHDVIVLADSDIAVEPDYLDTVTAPLADPDTGVVTCLYRAQSVGGFWPRVGALFINEWFAPSVRVAHVGGSRRFGFGATLALRRTTLESIGGFETLKDCLADDYWLAEHARTLGLNTVLSPVMVATDVIEPTFTTLWLREMRWLRTIRSVNPLGFAFLFVTFTTPWLLAGMLLTVSRSSEQMPLQLILSRRPRLRSAPLRAAWLAFFCMHAALAARALSGVTCRSCRCATRCSRCNGWARYSAPTSYGAARGCRSSIAWRSHAYRSWRCPMTAKTPHSTPHSTPHPTPRRAVAPVPTFLI